MARQNERSSSTRLALDVTVSPGSVLGVSGPVAATLLAIAVTSCLSGREAAGPVPFGQPLMAGAAALCWTFAVVLVTLWLANLRQLCRSAIPDSRLGQYTLDEKIGEGGMGVVYKASHALLRRPAAIKLLPPERDGRQNVERFEREVQLTSRLTHPNTVSIYDFGRTAQGTFYYAMEYLEGCDLQTLVDRHGPQDPARVAHLLVQLTGALAEAHGVGLIHRDVKPANVMLCERGGLLDVLKVVDFGLSQELAPKGTGPSSDAQRIMGTPLYLSPEAITAPESIGAQSDIYAVGAVGYFLLTGVPPFSGQNMVEVCAHHLHSQPVPPSQRLGTSLPSKLETLILSCLAKSPEQRPSSAAALQASLHSYAVAWTQERAANWWTTRMCSPRLERPRAAHGQGLGKRPDCRVTELAA
jgi:serine/threonine-protein kinase